MSDTTDHYIDKMLFPRFPEKRITWLTADGRELEPQEMSDDHLLNCIHLCERREAEGILFLNENALTYRAMVSELIERGKLKYAYFDLSINERLAFRFMDWSEFE